MPANISQTLNLFVTANFMLVNSYHINAKSTSLHSPTPLLLTVNWLIRASPLLTQSPPSIAVSSSQSSARTARMCARSP